jgi:thioredoxin 1
MQAIAYIVLAALGLFAALQWWLKRKALRLQGQPLPELDAVLAERLKARGKAMLYFYSPNCGPCRAMTPVIERLAKDHDNVFKFDVSKDMATARNFKVLATPTVMVLSTKLIESVTLGAVSEQRLIALLG